MEKTPENLNPNTGSIDPSTISLTYETTGSDRHMATMYRKLESMEKELHELKTQKILDETQLPPEILASSGLLPCKIKKLKRGRGYRPILQSEIEEAKKHSVFGAGQARWLGVSITCYRKYCKLYGIWEPRPNEKGKKQPHDPERGKYPLNKILTGDFNGNPFVTDWVVKRKMFRAGTFPMECSQCGYNKIRLGREYPTLLVDHMDGDRKNYKLESLRLLCLNCTDECGRGYLTRGFRSFDPDWQPNTNNE